MKQPYSDFVRHCLQGYVETMEIGTQPRFRHQIEKANWLCCHEAMNDLDPEDRELALELYARGDTIPDKIYQISMQKRMPQRRLWRLVEELEQDIARRRGMIW